MSTVPIFDVINVTGPQATHTLCDGAGWQTRGCRLLEAAITHGRNRRDLPSDREIGGHTTARDPIWTKTTMKGRL